MKGLTSYNIILTRFEGETLFSKSEWEHIKEICDSIDEVADPEFCEGYTINFDEKTSIISLSTIVPDITIRKDGNFWEACNMMENIKISPFDLEEDEVDSEAEPRHLLDIEFSFRP